MALTDVRLDALDKAREVDMLRETVHRLKAGFTPSIRFLFH